MADETRYSYSESDIEAVAQKLGAFGQGLSPSEQAVLINLLQRAVTSSEENDTSGYVLSSPANFKVPSAVLGLALGLPVVSAASINPAAFRARPQEFCG